jgi:glycosyltransferase involved in cell wall biosynthesis
MSDTPPTISVIICAYTENRWNDLLAAVESIRQQVFAAYEIILVIDYNPALLARAQTQMPDIIIKANTESRGLSGARNSGVAAAHGELIAFLDDDAIAHPRWLELMARCCQDPHVLGAGGKVIPLWPDQHPAWFPKEFYWVIGCSYQDFHDEVTRVRNAFGGNICFRREVFETVGGFRTALGRSDAKHLPLGDEETELCIRAQHHWPDRFFVCDPRAVSEHRILPQRINTRYFRSRCYAEGLSKAMMIAYTGVKDGLATEQMYTRKILPRGVLQGIGDGFRGDLAGFARAWMIIVGLTATIFGYIIGILSRTFKAGENVHAYPAPVIPLTEDKSGKEIYL